MDSKRTKLANVSDIPEGKSIVVSLPSGLEIALFKVKGEIYALDNVCPHEGGPLGEGALCEYSISCPWHGWEFDVRDGGCTNVAGAAALPIQIAVEEGIVYLKQ